MKFTVIIPTRERSDTLYYTLKTCVTQDYDDLEILVSDNFSQDNTREVVESFEDKRIRYINTGKRVSMSRNWEFALDHVNEGYFTFLGDDDGLLPDAVSDINSILQVTGTLAVSWLKAFYAWPTLPEINNLLSIPLRNSLIICPAKKIRRDLITGLCSYSRGPCFYNGFVDKAVVDKIKTRTGTFFKSITPDAYSSLAALSEIDEYYYSTRPFSVNGASHHSNGHACGTYCVERSDALSPTDKFMNEIDLPIHSKMDVILGSVNSNIAEAFLQANSACYIDKLGISTTYWKFRIARELSYKTRNTYEVGMSKLDQLDSSALGKWTFRLSQVLLPNRPSPPSVPHYGLNIMEGVLCLDARAFDINNIFEASQLVRRLLGKYEMPCRQSGYSSLANVWGLLQRFFDHKFN